MQNDHHWLQMRNIRRMEERVRVRLRRRIVPDRSNPFQDLAEDEFFLRFRLSKECVLNLLQNITEQLPIAADARGCPIPQHLQVLITLRFILSVTRRFLRLGNTFVHDSGGQMWVKLKEFLEVGTENPLCVCALLTCGGGDTFGFLFT
ncbi:hypothetical protein Pcinc_002607 [Petrolisthes cinctipes]|uniref:Uncharacterized protein n=1 Tax=Petrolisthes cinctipes TaxID=88211 RepID=A0AAE1KPN9_PETCI|nr:hypothetical protein Pcinc_013986 [Petrolisthes cinctipes]KAK3893542.1 hypothetical protein Pcinc_002607 [Petrolisthes cinctipes]